MKEPDWPLMLVLSGVPTLGSYVRSEEQLSHLLTPVHFDQIRLGAVSDPTRDPDTIELNKLIYAYADLAEIDVEDVMTLDFVERLDFACSSRWGLVIELLIRTLALCRIKGMTAATVEMFAEGYDPSSRLPKGLSPFTAPDYRNIFDRDKLMELLENV